MIEKRGQNQGGKRTGLLALRAAANYSWRPKWLRRTQISSLFFWTGSAAVLSSNKERPLRWLVPLSPEETMSLHNVLNGTGELYRLGLPSHGEQTSVNGGNGAGD